VANRSIREIKERARARGTQYKYILVPRVLIVNTMFDILSWIHVFFDKGLQPISPMNIYDLREI
jgi:hypothetical protein